MKNDAVGGPERLPQRTICLAWLSDTRGTLLGRGLDLGDALGAAGYADNVATASRWLSDAERAGWIVRGANPDQTHPLFRSIAFFGAGGMPGGSKTPDPVCYAYAPTYTKRK